MSGARTPGPAAGVAAGVTAAKPPVSKPHTTKVPATKVPATIVPLTLITGPTAAAREELLAACLPPGGRSAAILEGLPDGRSVLFHSGTIDLHRVAPACLCCTGNLVLRVTLNRILRLQPDRIYIGVANLDHLDQLRSWLHNPPYDQLLELTPDLRCT